MNQPYFEAITDALHNAGICTPTLVLDKERLDRNIDHLIDVLNKGFDYRLITKSLPSVPLLQYVMRRTGTQRLMCTHLPFLKQLVSHVPSADILMGKPFPIRAVRHFYDWHQQQNACACFAPEMQLQWLIDSPERLQDYETFASERNLNLRISLELDVGLHRGGFRRSSDLVEAVNFIGRSRHLTLTSLMGYEAHIPKMPGYLGGPAKAFADAKGRYLNFIRAIEDELGSEALLQLTLNTGSSTTYSLYSESSHASEISAGSALIKPLSLDITDDEERQPSAFIAAPVLRKVSKPEVPLSPALSALCRAIGILPRNAAYIYGGNWIAQPCYPEGAQRVRLHGRSSNQELYGLTAGTRLGEDDFLFFRPRHTAAVFQQFGQIAVYDNGKITDWWPVYRELEGQSTPLESSRRLTIV